MTDSSSVNNDFVAMGKIVVKKIGRDADSPYQDPSEWSWLRKT